MPQAAAAVAAAGATLLAGHAQVNAAGDTLYDKVAALAAAVDALQAGGKKAAGKSSRTGKKSITKAPQTPEGGKRTKGSTGTMTVSQYRKFLQQMGKGKKK